MLYLLIRLPAAFQYITIRIVTQSPQRAAFSLITHYSSYDHCFLIIRPVIDHRKGNPVKNAGASLACPEREISITNRYIIHFFSMNGSYGLSKFTIGSFNNFF